MRRMPLASFSMHGIFMAFLLAGIAATAQAQGTPDNSSNGFHGQMGSKLPLAAVHLPDIVSDSMGVDFAPYFHQSLLPSLRRSWHSVIRERGITPTSPLKLAAEFTVHKDGTLDELKIAESSGDAEADQAALDAIRNAGPFAALPAEFKGESLRLRCRMDAFFPFRADGITPPQIIPPQVTAEYSDQARRKHVEGTVLLSLLVNTDGEPRDIKIIHSLGSGLDEKAVEAVEKWRFHPAMKDGSPVAQTISAEVSFHLYK
jgi:TonB family protein